MEHRGDSLQVGTALRPHANYRRLAFLLELDYAAVRDLAAPVRPKVPELATPAVPDLGVYDALLAGAAR